jgi:S-adenosylmethionine synthetase
MIYQFCKRGGEWFELTFSDRFEVTHYVEEHKTELQTFAVHESGSIYGYAVELSARSKPTAILYPHKVAQLIWIDMLS